MTLITVEGKLFVAVDAEDSIVEGQVKKLSASLLTMSPILIPHKAFNQVPHPLSSASGTL